MDNSGLRRFSKNVVVGSESNTNIDIAIKDLASTPDGFSEQESTELAMFAIALAGGFPPRDLWPATTVGATKADALFQQLSGVSGYETILRDMAFMLGGSINSKIHLTRRFIPHELKISFDFVDDDKDDRQASIKSKRAEIRQVDLSMGVVDIRTAREQALSAGDITQAQFNALELADGRLPNGGETISLFLSTDKDIVEMLSLPFEELLNVQKNIWQKDDVINSIDEKILVVNTIIMNEKSVVLLKKARQALSALEHLKKMYEEYNGKEKGKGKEAIAGESAKVTKPQNTQQ